MNSLTLRLIGRNTGSDEETEYLELTRSGSWQPAHQQRVFTAINADKRLPLGLEYRLTGDGGITYIADSDQLNPSVVSVIRQVFQDALMQLES